MKKMMLFFIFVFTTSLFNFSFGQNSMDIDTTNEGVVAIEYNEEKLDEIRIIIQKESQKYVYHMHNAQEYFPLQMGEGVYTVTLLENVSGNKYRVISSENIDVTIDNENAVFLNSIQVIQWDDSMLAVKKIKQLVTGIENDREKIKVIYEYIINNIEYDYYKASIVKNDYLPEIEFIFNSKSGICYDYASLFAAMLRSVDIPTKLVMGYTTYFDDYHAWNEVYISSEDKWIVIDTTIDAQYRQKDIDVNMEKNKSDYTNQRVY
ncbi:transglutaminase family protein [Fusibacter sp. 3D3]|uniref:transglutaminase-like domain-containing protein n=1 Tax=Fusibacter sp. 3D3 TaxID=1048380 RepID=UPI000852EC62|nr:transglutaminase-like domain-containing protein [Fusibacter sp. 3D3]GAU79828.1 transglutaminase-like enzyme [Fusibacter sp. 3D3]